MGCLSVTERYGCCLLRRAGYTLHLLFTPSHVGPHYTVALDVAAFRTDLDICRCGVTPGPVVAVRWLVDLLLIGPAGWLFPDVWLFALLFGRFVGWILAVTLPGGFALIGGYSRCHSDIDNLCYVGYPFPTFTVVVTRFGPSRYTLVFPRFAVTVVVRYVCCRLFLYVTPRYVTPYPLFTARSDLFPLLQRASVDLDVTRSLYARTLT